MTAAGSAAAIARGVVSAVATLDPTLSLRVRTLSDQVDAALTQDRLVAMLAGFFGVLALLLAGIGVYGVTAYGVHRRRTELGLRMALGAAPAGVMRLVLRRVAVLTAIGVAAGGAASFWAARFVGSLLY
jgi:putative ABC transport system permease protein